MLEALGWRADRFSNGKQTLLLVARSIVAVYLVAVVLVLTGVA